MIFCFGTQADQHRGSSVPSLSLAATTVIFLAFVACAVGATGWPWSLRESQVRIGHPRHDQMASAQGRGLLQTFLKREACKRNVPSSPKKWVHNKPSFSSFLEWALWWPPKDVSTSQPEESLNVTVCGKRVFADAVKDFGIMLDLGWAVNAMTVSLLEKSRKRSDTRHQQRRDGCDAARSPGCLRPLEAGRGQQQNLPESLRREHLPASTSASDFCPCHDAKFLMTTVLVVS